MSHGLGSMQRLLLQTVTTMLAEPTMGLFRQPRAACDHQQAPWYLTGPDAYTGTCLCRVVRRDELLGRVLYVRRQAGETVTEAVHQASAGAYSASCALGICARAGVRSRIRTCAARTVGARATTCSTPATAPARRLSPCRSISRY